VGRDILLGCLAGALSIPVLGIINVGTRRLIDLPACFSIPYPPTLAPLAEDHTIYGIVCDAVVNGVYTGFILLLFPIAVEQFAELFRASIPLASPVRINLRRASLFVVWLIITVFLYFYYGEPTSSSFVWFIYMGLWVAMFLYVTHKVGVLASIVMVTTLEILVTSPVTNNTQLWYFGTGLKGISAAAMFALAGLWIVFGVPQLFKSPDAVTRIG
jgi:hypothetical protein